MPPPAAYLRAGPVPPDLSLEHLWQVRSGWNAKGPWVTLDVVTSRMLETRYQEHNYDTVVAQADEYSSYFYDFRAWERRQRPGEVYGRPLRRVPWVEQFDEAWSAMGPEHALGGFCIPADAKDSGGQHGSADDDHAMSDEEEVWWQFRGGQNGDGAWWWSQDSEWLEAAYQNRQQKSVVRKTYGEDTYEFDFTTLMQRNVFSKTAPPREIRRWKASLDLPSD